MPITDGLDQAFAQAGLDLLAADLGPPPLVVFDGLVPPNTSADAGYVLVYTYTSYPKTDPDNSLTNDSVVRYMNWVCHCVCGTASGSRGVAARARTALLNKIPVVAGLACGKVEMLDSVPPQRDETTGVLVMDAVETYRCKATR